MKRLFSLLIVSFLMISALGGSSLAESTNGEIDGEELNQIVQETSLLLKLKEQLFAAKYRYFLQQSNIEFAIEGLDEIHDVVENLKLTVASLGEQLTDANKQILSVKEQKEVKKMDLEELEENAAIMELQLEDQKELIGELITMIYLRRDIYFGEDGLNPVKILASENTVSESLQEITYLDMIESTNAAEIERMIAFRDGLGLARAEIATKQQELNSLDAQLAEHLGVIEEEYLSQVDLLEETIEQETIFSAMLSSSNDREEDLLFEIEIYEANIDEVVETLSEKRDLLNDEQKELIDKIEEDLMGAFDVSGIASETVLSWPVSPRAGLTAFYLDEAYKSRFGVEHRSLDIRASHGSEIHAPADGVVYKVTYDEESTKYAYVMIAHANGIMSVFGHISDVEVLTGEYVKRGDVIAYSGATPGSVGAGARTTGAHLHMEVWRDGGPVDPLLYLPLEEVPSRFLPEEYRVQIEEQLKNGIREVQDALGL